MIGTDKLDFEELLDPIVLLLGEDLLAKENGKEIAHVWIKEDMFDLILFYMCADPIYGPMFDDVNLDTVHVLLINDINIYRVAETANGDFYHVIYK